jgi:hypothetical protein
MNLHTTISLLAFLGFQGQQTLVEVLWALRPRVLLLRSWEELPSFVQARKNEAMARPRIGSLCLLMCVVMLAGVPLYQKFWTTQSSLMRAQRNKLVCPLLSPRSPMQNYYSFFWWILCLGSVFQGRDIVMHLQTGQKQSFLSLPSRVMWSPL